MADARAAILGRIRQELGRTAIASPAAAPAEIESDYHQLPRAYQTSGKHAPEQCVARLLDRLADYDAEVIEVEEAALPAAIASVLTRDREPILLIPHDLPPAWLPSGIELLRDEPGDGALPLASLTRAPAVLTACAGAIAETGTILLHHGHQQGRRVLTLLPDHHLCVLRRDQIVETVSEGFHLLAGTSTGSITTISGPSATADIEMTRIRGVHGPRRLTVCLLS